MGPWTRLVAACLWLSGCVGPDRGATAAPDTAAADAGVGQPTEQAPAPETDDPSATPKATAEITFDAEPTSRDAVVAAPQREGFGSLLDGVRMAPSS